MTTLKERIEANADLVLWCVHVLGPDDVLAAPSHEAAVVRARQMNQSLHRGGPEDVLCFAYAAPWPHSKDAHSLNLMEQALRQTEEAQRADERSPQGEHQPDTKIDVRATGGGQ
jgi:hypothetical protein